MGTDGGGINVNKKGINAEFYSAKTGDVSSNSFLASLKDANDDLWFGSQQGIDIYRHHEKRFVHYAPMAQNAIITSLFEDENRNIWIGSNEGIEIYNLASHQKTHLNTNNSALPTNEIRAISEDINGNIWIGTLNKGVALYQPSSKEMLYLSKDTILCEGRINQIFRDSKNQMWVATNDGLFLFPTSQLDNFRIYDSKNGLASNLISSVQEDDEGNIWVSTHDGISCLLVNDNRFHNYDHTDGALFGTYMTNSTAKSSDGTIYFGSINGVCFFNPKDKEIKKEIPPVVFNEFMIHGKSMQGENNEVNLPVQRGEMELNHDQNIFSVGFNVMDKSLQGNIEYAYRMEGLSQSWINIGDMNVVTFRDIPYRNYDLQVKARYKNDPWKDSYTTLSIKVHPPLWQSWWAKTLYFLSFSLIIFFMIRSYKRRLKLRNALVLEKERAQKQLEMKEERLVFYSNITHELKTPLTLMLGPLEDLQNKADLQKEHQKKISLIHKSTIRLLSLISQILEFRKTETHNKKLYVVKEDLADKIREVVMKYRELNRNKHLSIEVKIETPQTVIYFDPEVITMVLDNLISNSLKFTQKGHITVTLHSVRANNLDHTEIEVSDSGCGISEEDLPHIFERYYNPRKKKNTPGFGIGLAFVKNLVELHEGKISVESKPNKGAIFRVRLMTQNAYPDANHIVNAVPDKTVHIKNKPIVLIVEDDHDMRGYIADALKGGYEVMIAGDGKTGLEAARESIPDLIISDIMMPIMDGIEFCQQIKNDLATSHIPVILLTAKDDIQDKTEGYSSGANSYITKPFNEALLRSRISNLLEERKKIAALFSSGKTIKRSQMQESLNQIDNEFLEKFTRLIESNLKNDKINTPEIAQELSMSYSSLYRKIKA
ncbi:DNA-binding response regulator, AraC family [Geofilum rubicundum JCM 15548]|uniref:histidine kinase n=2 Tax=Geofilum TaxID=1236988 RepID=A0A0E9M408_9BACT|nr:DNA-binding response regulator, AraC family [Geofilum rubicundum JCM 15548]